jgi:hypothetical protein
MVVFTTIPGRTARSPFFTQLSLQQMLVKFMLTEHLKYFTAQSAVHLIFPPSHNVTNTFHSLHILDN